MATNLFDESFNPFPPNNGNKIQFELKGGLNETLV
jgi:hypothetical protein